jgi:hypothetical protein
MSLPPPMPVAEYAPRYQKPPTDDAGHLKLLAIFHFVVAGMAALFGSFPLIHVGIGVAIVTGNMNFPQQPTGSNAQPFDERWIGWMFIAMGGLFVLAGWTIAVLSLISGFQIKNRRGRMFSLVVAGVMCVFFPIGTTLGVFTIMVLVRDSVKGLYAEKQQPTAETA